MTNILKEKISQLHNALTLGLGDNLGPYSQKKEQISEQVLLSPEDVDRNNRAYERIARRRLQEIGDGSLELAILRRDPSLGRNPAIAVRLGELQFELQSHMSVLDQIGVPTEIPTRIVEAGENAVEAVGQTAILWTLSTLGPKKLFSAVREGQSPEQILGDTITQEMKNQLGVRK